MFMGQTCPGFYVGHPTHLYVACLEGTRCQAIFSVPSSVMDDVGLLTASMADHSLNHSGTMYRGRAWGFGGRET